MALVEREGVYLLCSCDAFGKRIYKVGRSDNLRQRLKDYPPNWCLIDCLPCEKSCEMEKKLIKGFKQNFKLYDRHEYFEIEAGFTDVKMIFNKILCGEKIPEECAPRTNAAEPEKKKKKEKEPAANPKPKTKTIDELREEQLQTFDGVMKRSDIEDSMKDFNKLIDVIISVIGKPKDEQKKLIVKHLEGLVAKKRSKDFFEDLFKDGLEHINVNMKITKKEVDKLFK